MSASFLRGEPDTGDAAPRAGDGEGGGQQLAVTQVAGRPRRPFLPLPRGSGGPGDGVSGSAAASQLKFSYCGAVSGAPRLAESRHWF